MQLFGDGDNLLENHQNQGHHGDMIVPLYWAKS